MRFFWYIHFFLNGGKRICGNEPRDSVKVVWEGSEPESCYNSHPYFLRAMLTILDSRVNKAGRLKALYVKTEKGVLFEVKPHVRIPGTFKRFAGIMLQLRQKLSITAVGKREKLLRVIKNPVSQYLHIDCRKIGFSHSSEKLVDIQDYINGINNDMNLVFVVRAMAHGKIEKDYVEDYLSCKLIVPLFFFIFHQY
ncbi:ribosomal RNA small subunit methyltransferase NEP1-like [Nicotiana tabacum]|uniref:Ribosomal RNA small subunit methyltransferase NEP1-like n=2 Tax=Nicotiana tabacum TaxID=4097 RepID=A0A1S3XVX4_TOBAC|nr:PREDICTED: ribosomal RNA small subunit methyltransferase NEP1-like isoform X1 [Nicotiana tabacum]